MQPTTRPSPPPPKSVKSPKSPHERQPRTKRRVLVAHACRNGPCRYLVQAVILAFLFCALGLMGYSLHLRLYSTKLASMSSSPSHSHNADGSRALLASLNAVAHPPPPSLVPLTAVKNRSLLLFSVMRDYNSRFAGTAADEYARYTLALTSWLSLSTMVASAAARGEYSVGRLDVVLFVDSVESCVHVKGTWPSVVCRVSGTLRNGSSNDSGGSDGCMHKLSDTSRPYLHCIWRHIADHVRSSARHYHDIVYVNGDVILFPSLLDTLTLVHRSYPATNASYALVTRRRDASFTNLTPAALAPKLLQRTQQRFTANSSSGTGSQLHDPLGIDAFLLSSTLLPSIASAFPDFLVGSYRWDNWLLATLLRGSSFWQPVVDGTDGWVAGHDSVQSDHSRDEGRKWNDGVVKRSMGKWWQVGSVTNADMRVMRGARNGSTADGLRLEVNRDEREQVQLYRYISSKQGKEQQSTDTHKV